MMARINSREPKSPVITRDVRDWLLDSPVLRAVSMLVLDAAMCGLIDIEDEIARAVTLDARMRTLCYPELRRPHMRYMNKHRRYPPRPRVRIEDGVAVLEGSISKSGAIRQTRTTATLDTDVVIPDTLVAALPGRPLSSIVSSPLLDGRNYTIAAAESTDMGTDITVRIPAIPIAGIRTVMSVLRPDFSARPKPGRARSR